MSRFKRITMILLAMLLFTCAAMSAYAAASPTKREYVEMTTDDGVTVKLYKMPDNLDMLSDQTKEFYAAMIEMAKQGMIELYIGEVKEGKYAGDVLIKTAFPQKAAIMDDKNRADMDLAYNETKEAEGQLDTLVPEIKTQAAAQGVPVEDCRVSEIFDLTYYRLTDTWRKSDEHGVINVEMGSEALTNYVGLMHRNNGEWENVDDAQVTGENRDTLTFSAKDLSPFAIVVWGNEGVGTGTAKSPKTEDNTIAWAGSAASAVVLLMAAGYVLITAAKKRRQ